MRVLMEYCRIVAGCELADTYPGVLEVLCGRRSVVMVDGVL